MKDKEKLEKWIRVDAILHEKLKQLNQLDKERNMLLQEAQKTGNLSSDMQKLMQESLKKYEILANEINELKKLALYGTED